MILTLNCEDSARLTSESMDRKLNWAERAAVSGHRLVCSKSRRLNRQLLQLNEALKSNNAFDLEDASVEGLSSDAKSRISAAISDTQND
jgi:hypothetical protein